LKDYRSTEVAKMATRMAISSREEEEKLSEEFLKKGAKVAAVDIGGNITESIHKILERAMVSAKRNKLITDQHLDEGAIIGATRDAIMQVINRCNGQSVGGKVGIARKGEHISVCIFLSIGLLHLDEVVIGIGHRGIPNNV
jgi:hypothetical protein